MTRIFSSALVALVVLGSLALPTARAQPEGIGVGAALGVTNSVFNRDPVGLSGKGWISGSQAVSGLTSFYLGSEDQSYWTLRSDYLFHNFNAVSVEKGFLALYVGGGVQYTVLEGTSNQWALRAPTGITYISDSASLDIFVEVAPALRLTDPESLRFDGAIGFRYYFSAGSGGSRE
ncbi:MAG: hypothetical protein ABEL04_02385 [Salinibacter sp.]|uniref:hypothetical protein n=1 Tax=Salinibacter sp. TaxID=2065818 RepID=UPI0035D44BD1